MRGAVQRQVEAPQRGAEGVGETWPALVVERVGFAEDEGQAREGGDVAGERELGREFEAGGGVVHERALEGYAGLGGAGDVTGGEEGMLIFWENKGVKERGQDDILVARELGNVVVCI